MKGIGSRTINKREEGNGTRVWVLLGIMLVIGLVVSFGLAALMMPVIQHGSTMPGCGWVKWHLIFDWQTRLAAMRV